MARNAARVQRVIFSCFTLLQVISAVAADGFLGNTNIHEERATEPQFVVPGTIREPDDTDATFLVSRL